MLCNAGTNRQEDVDIYAFEPPSPADAGMLNNVAVNSSDEVLKALLRADIKTSRCIAGWENHKENLPEDPSQVSCSKLDSDLHTLSTLVALLKKATSYGPKPG